VEYDKEQNVAVTGAATNSCLKRRFQNVLSTVTYCPSHRQVDASVKNLQATRRISLDLCTNVLFVATVIHIQTLRSQIHIYIYIYMGTALRVVKVLCYNSEGRWFDPS